MKANSCDKATACIEEDPKDNGGSSSSSSSSSGSSSGKPADVCDECPRLYCDCDGEGARERSSCAKETEENGGALIACAKTCDEICNGINLD